MGHHTIHQTLHILVFSYELSILISFVILNRSLSTVVNNDFDQRKSLS
jgi:hypothetical protein